MNSTKQKLTITVDDETLAKMKIIAEECNLTLEQLGEYVLTQLEKEYKEKKKLSSKN
jgi:hypothetical protein